MLLAGLLATLFLLRPMWDMVAIHDIFRASRDTPDIYLSADSRARFFANLLLRTVFCVVIGIVFLRWIWRSAQFAQRIVVLGQCSVAFAAMMLLPVAYGMLMLPLEYPIIIHPSITTSDTYLLVNREAQSWTVWNVEKHLIEILPHPSDAPVILGERKSVLDLSLLASTPSQPEQAARTSSYETNKRTGLNRHFPFDLPRLHR